ncbi:hypothetical protein WJ438_38285 [Streptomyces sp. GD-15H]|uniref:hypothetical protein n=1 Tax=Streptomyces sp. GD-15H TaxID=3129112 RepID=UPI003243A86C
MACSAVVTGAKTFTAIGGWATKAPQDALARLGARTATALAVRISPSSATGRIVGAGGDGEPARTRPTWSPPPHMRD